VNAFSGVMKLDTSGMRRNEFTFLDMVSQRLMIDGPACLIPEQGGHK
jgi:hypothetical protein